jgi:hypothetical protein
LTDEVVSRNSKALLSAAERDNWKAAELLLDHGAEVNWQGEDEKTALFIAVEAGHRPVVEVLLQHGARLDLTRRDGRTVFDAAMDKNHLEIAHLILDRFCTLNKAPNSAILSLDKAIRNGDFHQARNLLQTGASVALRLTRTTHLPGEEPVVGHRNEYLNTLCSNIVTLEQSLKSRIKDDPRGAGTGSDQAFLRTSQWLVSCLTQHSNCIKAEAPLPPLPSRVIDVGSPDGSQEPRLLQTQFQKGRYIALSHRWGDSNIAKTTKKNISQRLLGIKYNDLTKTMQDSVTITRKLGVRYLWIDAICIIQDSHSDWSIEACDMANIYRNALLTIAAASAAKHSEGCFSSRDAKGPPDILDSRGWILQEQLLSQRVLKYNFGCIEWECISLSASELAHTEESTSTQSEVVRFKRALGGFRSTSMALQRQAHASWQQIVQSYSSRTLTNEADKLMAIMGIAKFTGSILQDTFLAGIWKDQLWRDLLWSSQHPYGGTRVTSIKLPSWSWASVRGGVSYRWPSGSASASVKGLLTLISTDVEQEVSNGNVRGRLVVTGRMRQVFRGVGSAFEGTRLYFKEIEEERPSDSKRDLQSSSSPGKLPFENYMLHKMTSGQHAGAIFWPDVEAESFENAWLLPIATGYYWTHCLALVAASPGCSDFKRVGLCHVDNLTSSTWVPETRTIGLV